MGLTASKEVKKPKSKKETKDKKDTKKKLPKVVVKGKKPVKGKKMKGGDDDDKCSSTYCPNCDKERNMTGVTNGKVIIGYRCPVCKVVCAIDV